MTYADPWPTTFVKWQGSLKRAGNVFFKPWRAPRLSAEGKPFAPTGVEVGAWVAPSSRTTRAASVGPASKPH